MGHHTARRSTGPVSFHLLGVTIELLQIGQASLHFVRRRHKSVSIVPLFVYEVYVYFFKYNICAAAFCGSTLDVSR